MSDYGSLLGVALPGTLGDTGDHNFDGSCVVSPATAHILSGKIVWGHYDQESGYVIVSDQFDGSKAPCGVTVRSQYCTETDERGMSATMKDEPVSILTHGRIWVLTKDIDSPATHSQLVHVNHEGFASRTGWPVSGWHYTGGWHKLNNLYNICEIQVLQNMAHLDDEIEQGTPVSEASISTDIQSPARAGTNVLFTVSVEPGDATNKRGSWSLDKPEAGMLVPNGNDGDKVVFAGNYTGTITVNWVADDGSGVTAFKEFTFN
jgi:hypothetical protein